MQNLAVFLTLPLHVPCNILLLLPLMNHEGYWSSGAPFHTALFAFDSRKVLDSWKVRFTSLAPGHGIRSTMWIVCRSVVRWFGRFIDRSTGAIEDRSHKSAQLADRRRASVRWYTRITPQLTLTNDGIIFLVFLLFLWCTIAFWIRRICAQSEGGGDDEEVEKLDQPLAGV